MHTYTVIVGNIGVVEETDLIQVARVAFNFYARMSQRAIGRGAGELVTLLCDGDVAYEYDPQNDPDGTGSLCNA